MYVSSPPTTVRSPVCPKHNNSGVCLTAAGSSGLPPCSVCPRTACSRGPRRPLRSEATERFCWGCRGFLLWLGSRELRGQTAATTRPMTAAATPLPTAPTIDRYLYSSVVVCNSRYCNMGEGVRYPVCLVRGKERRVHDRAGLAGNIFDADRRHYSFSTKTPGYFNSVWDVPWPGSSPA